MHFGMLREDLTNASWTCLFPSTPYMCLVDGNGFSVFACTTKLQSSLQYCTFYIMPANSGSGLNTETCCL